MLEVVCVSSREGLNVRFRGVGGREEGCDGNRQREVELEVEWIYRDRVVVRQDQKEISRERDRQIERQGKKDRQRGIDWERQRVRQRKIKDRDRFIGEKNRSGERDRKSDVKYQG